MNGRSRSKAERKGRKEGAKIRKGKPQGGLTQQCSNPILCCWASQA